MKPISRAGAFILATVAGLTLLHLLGVRLVPFHPDEASLLFQSRDLETLLSDPLALGYDPEREGELDQDYRALNAPLPKYILGAGRVLAGGSTDSVAIDWDWSESWQENEARGAVPTERTLIGARLASTALIPVTLACLYLVGRHLGGSAVGWLAVLLMGLSALSLLHTRRAMAEGVMILAMTASLLGLLYAHRRPGLAGIATGLAMASKASAIPLLPLGLLAASWPIDSSRKDRPGGRWWLVAFRYLAAAALVFLVLNPFLWPDPIAGANRMWQARRDLVQDQVQALSAMLPEAQLDTPGKRISAMIAQLFVLPPQFSEVGNYEGELADQQAAYRRSIMHSLLRGWIGGGTLLLVSGIGFALATLSMRGADAAVRRSVALLALTTVIFVLALIAAVPLPFQRYYMPLLPMVCLWTAHGIWHLIEMRKGLPVCWAAPE